MSFEPEPALKSGAETQNYSTPVNHGCNLGVAALLGLNAAYGHRHMSDTPAAANLEPAPPAVVPAASRLDRAA
ncbi:MAG TPA: hypothetical protein VFZ93_04645, partial [Albitalea sp.]